MRVVSRACLPAAFATLLAALLPAAAQQDSVSQEFQDIRKAFGLGPTITPMDFTERPPLVVPPTYNLPRPVDVGPGQLGVNDVDTMNRRRALVDPRRPVPQTDPGAAAAGLSARTYLVDPPSGLRDPDVVAADITHGGTAAEAPKRHARVRKKKPAPSATE